MKNGNLLKSLAVTISFLILATLTTHAQFNPPGYLSLDGNGDYARTTPTLIQGTNPISLSVWCKMRTDEPAGYHAILNTGTEIAPYLNEYNHYCPVKKPGKYC